MGYRKAIAGFALVCSVSSAFAFACSSFDGDVPAPPDASDDSGKSDGGGGAETSTHSFCDDYRDADLCFSFENGDPVDPRIGAGLVSVSVGAAAQLVSDASTSPPNSLEIDVVPGTPPGFESPKAGVRVVAPDAGTKARCEFSFMVDPLDGGSNASNANSDIVLVGVPSISNSGGRLFDFSARLVPDAGDQVEIRTGSSNDHSTAKVVTRGTWLHAAVFLELIDGKVQEYGRVEGAFSAPKKGVLDPQPNLPNQIGPFVMELGQSYVTGEWLVRIDDIVCYWN